MQKDKLFRCPEMNSTRSFYIEFFAWLIIVTFAGVLSNKYGTCDNMFLKLAMLVVVFELYFEITSLLRNFGTLTKT